MVIFYEQIISILLTTNKGSSLGLNVPHLDGKHIKPWNHIQKLCSHCNNNHVVIILCKHAQYAAVPQQFRSKVYSHAVGVWRRFEIYSCLTCCNFLHWNLINDMCTCYIIVLCVIYLSHVGLFYPWDPTANVRMNSVNKDTYFLMLKDTLTKSMVC